MRYRARLFDINHVDFAPQVLQSTPMTQINQKLNVPVNWDKTLLYSTASLGSLLLVGFILKIRVIIAIAEIGAVALLCGLLIGIFISVLRKYIN